MVETRCLDLDYYIFELKCKSINEDGYEVIVNNETGETLWLKKSEIIFFRLWERFFIESYGVARLKSEKQVIREKPDENSKEINYPEEYDCFRAQNMKGDWIEIYTPSDCDDAKSNFTVIKSGWIKWRSGDKLLIEYFNKD